MDVVDVTPAEMHPPAMVVRMRHAAPRTPARGLPVLFVHGSSFPSALSFAFRMDGESWMDWMAARGVESFALDFAGYGLSERHAQDVATPGRAGEAEQQVARAVEAVLRRTGQRQLWLVGHSWGASVAARYAQSQPDKVARLVLFAAITARGEAAGAPPPDDAYVSMTPAARIAAMDGLRPAAEPSQLHADVHTRWGGEWLASDAGGSDGQVRFPAGPLHDVADLRQGRACYDPARLRMPVLLVRGEWDGWPDDGDYRTLLARMTQAPEKRYVVIPRSTHVAQLELGRHALYQAVDDFLR